jgi:hypothetical protein
MSGGVLVAVRHTCYNTGGRHAGRRRAGRRCHGAFVTAGRARGRVCSGPGLRSDSGHHLSRVFAAITGHTISRHRMRLRTRAVLERLAAGEDDLAPLAADLGFTDPSHLYRIVRPETGVAPSVLRRLLT